MFKKIEKLKDMIYTICRQQEKINKISKYTDREVVGKLFGKTNDLASNQSKTK